MDFTNRSKSDLCRAFKQALGLLAAENVIEFKDIDAKSGLKTDNIRGFRAKPTPEDVAAIDAVFPGFRVVFEDYLNGGSRWHGVGNTDKMTAAVKDNEEFKEQMIFWRDKYLAENEQRIKLLYEMAKKDVSES